MIKSHRQIAIVGLRWTVGIVVALESLRFMFSPSTVHHLSRMGLPPWFRFALGGCEVLAALLFLISATRAVGAYALLCIFGIAALIHFLHGEFDIGGLAVYAMAVIASMRRQNQTSSGVDA
jgi:hypothetical protein